MHMYSHPFFTKPERASVDKPVDGAQRQNKREYVLASDQQSCAAAFC